MNRFDVEHWLYVKIARPVLFLTDCEMIHELMIKIGELFENMGWLFESFFSYRDTRLKKTLLGIEFDNPIGLAAGFDYDGHLAKTMKYVGFGFNTIGTVTAQPYEGNKRPMLARLVKSQSLLVNKGFKSEGAVAVAKRLDRKNLAGHTIGISVGSSHLPSVDTIEKATDDYLFTFNTFKNKPYVKYFELNISCPNTALTESFSTPDNFEKLITAVINLDIVQPIFIKMSNEMDPEKASELVELGLKHGIKGYIFSNVVKNRENSKFVKQEIEAVKDYKGNFSGKPCAENSNKLLKHIRTQFGDKVVLIGVGGIFSADDAKEKFNCGADLIQLITGMIFEGPQLAGEINAEL